MIHIEIQKLARIELRPDERVVAMTYFRDYVLVVTDIGSIYKITHDE